VAWRKTRSKRKVGASSDEAGLEGLRAELEQEHDRLPADEGDFENYKAPGERDRDVAAGGKRDLLIALVDLADGFDRALVHVGESPDAVRRALRDAAPAGQRVEAEG